MPNLRWILRVTKNAKTSGDWAEGWGDVSTNWQGVKMSADRFGPADTDKCYDVAFSDLSLCLHDPWVQLSFMFVCPLSFHSSNVWQRKASRLAGSSPDRIKFAYFSFLTWVLTFTNDIIGWNKITRNLHLFAFGMGITGSDWLHPPDLGC